MGFSRIHLSCKACGKLLTVHIDKDRDCNYWFISERACISAVIWLTMCILCALTGWVIGYQSRERK